MNLTPLVIEPSPASDLLLAWYGAQNTHCRRGQGRSIAKRCHAVRGKSQMKFCPDFCAAVPLHHLTSAARMLGELGLTESAATHAVIVIVTQVD